MSRDWTPRETYAMDKDYYNKNGLHFYEIPLVTKLGDTIISERPTKEDIELGKKYPYLMYVGIDALYKMKNIVAEDILIEVENYLKDLCEGDTFKSRTYYPNGFDNESINKWYNGELDNNFYHRERNDEYLIDYLSTIKDPVDIREPNKNDIER